MVSVEDVLHRAQELKFLGSMRVLDQVTHAQGFATVIRQHLLGEVTMVHDLGSGGGIPALVLAREFPLAIFHLIERGQKRAEFLANAAVSLDMADRVHVHECDAESAGRTDLRTSATVVTARSFAPPAVTAECAAPLLAPRGLLVVSEPPERDPSRWPAPALSELGLEIVADRQVVDGASYQVLRKVGPTPARYPRRATTTRKRPLWESKPR